MPELICSHQGLSPSARRAADVACMALVRGVNGAYSIAGFSRRGMIVSDANDRSDLRFVRIDAAFSVAGTVLPVFANPHFNWVLRAKTDSFALDVDLANAAICLDRRQMSGVLSLSRRRRSICARTDLLVKSENRTLASTGGRPRAREDGPLCARVQVSLSDRLLIKVDRFCTALWQANPGATVPLRGAVIRSAMEWMESQPKNRQLQQVLKRDRTASEERGAYHTKVRLLPSTKKALDSLADELRSEVSRMSRAALIRTVIDMYLDEQESAFGNSSLIISSTLQEVPAQECS